jgi:hypothetical protein
MRFLFIGDVSFRSDQVIFRSPSDDFDMGWEIFEDGDIEQQDQQDDDDVWGGVENQELLTVCWFLTV